MPLVVRLLVGVPLVLAGCTLLTVAVLGARSALRRNRWLGIRTRDTLGSEPAWVAAHRVAAAPAGAAGLVALVGGAVLLAGSESALLDGLVTAIAGVGTLGLAGFAGRVGERAAAAATPEPLPACAGACAGCDLIAGCRDAVAGHQPQEPGTPLNGPTTSEVTQPP